jgi:hypothetical protein
MSLGTLNEEGYCPQIGGRYLELTSPRGDQIGQVARSHKRLYKVNHDEDSANLAETLTIMELHHRLGHIAVSSARKLVESKAITGIKLDPNSQEAACDACIFMRTTRQPVPKV